MASLAARLFSMFVLTTLLVTGPFAMAGADIAMDVTNQGTVGFNGIWTLGYEFTANTDMEITHLGILDRDADGLAEAHDVAIWDSAGNLIVTASVGNADPITGFFRYASVAPHRSFIQRLPFNSRR